MTAKQLADWILKQPANIQNGQVTSVVHGHISEAKRVAAWESKNNSDDAGIYIESMGAHLNDSFSEGKKFVSVLNH